MTHTYAQISYHTFLQVNVLVTCVYKSSKHSQLNPFGSILKNLLFSCVKATESKQNVKFKAKIKQESINDFDQTCCVYCVQFRSVFFINSLYLSVRSFSFSFYFSLFSCHVEKKKIALIYFFLLLLPFIPLVFPHLIIFFSFFLILHICFFSYFMCVCVCVNLLSYCSSCV